MRYTAQPDPVTAEVNDDFGFTETWTTNDDYVQWNPVTGQDSYYLSEQNHGNL